MLIKCQAGCSTEHVVKALGLSMTDLFEEKPKARQAVAVYQYRDAGGKLLGEKLRYADKHFSWRRPAANGWEYKKPEAMVPYNLPAVLKNEHVYLVEGEKDVDAITAQGRPATCSPDGAGPGKWKDHFTGWFKGKYVYIIGDNDDVGRAYVQEEAEKLSKTARGVKVLDLCKLWPDLPEHGDTSDLMQRLGAAEAMGAIAKLAAETDSWQPRTETGLSIFKAADLIQKDLPPVHFVVDGLLPQGLALLASPPKYGKSWMVLDLCLAVATGGRFLGHRARRAGCLYLALEDSENRLQDRMKKVLNESQPPTDFYYLLQAPDLGHGLAEQIENFLRQTPAVKLVVVDTLQKVRGAPGGRDNAYAQDYKDTGALKAVADRYGVCVLLVHHLRKMADDGDPFNRISGTNGILGAADTAITLTRAKRSDEETRLSITGRDVDSEEIVLRFDKETFRWRVVGTAAEVDEQRAREEYNASSIVKTIKKLVEQSPGGWRGTMKDLLDAGKYIARDYLAGTPEELAKKVRSLEQPLFDNDGIIHERIKNGSGGSKHRFARSTVGEPRLTVDTEAPFTA